MIRVLLDTDHVSLHDRGHLPLRARLASFSSEEVAVSVVTVEEMLRGRLAILARRSEGEARVHAYTKLLETVHFFSTIPPKGNGKERPPGIPALEDKLVQLACAKLLMAIYEQDFMDCSYGYRLERSALDAVKDLTFDLQYGRYGHLLEVDVKGFFDHIDHDWLLDMLRVRIDDRAFLNLIRKWLKAGILETDGQVVHPNTGTPQVGVVTLPTTLQNCQ